MADKILQIIPADGKWHSRYEVESGVVETHHYPIICWALMETDEGQRYITAFDVDDGSGMIDDCSKIVGFSGFIYKE